MIAEQVALVLPCYNPHIGWEDELLEQLNKSPIQFHEVLVVNDGSTKLDVVAVRKLQSQLPQVRFIDRTINNGKGYTLRQGIAECQSNWVLYTDIDHPFTTDSVSRIHAALCEGCDVAVGVRDSQYYQQIVASRRFLSRLFRLCIKTFLRIPTDDTQCGLKGMNQRGRQVFLQTTINRYLFDLEFVFLASRGHLKIVLVPVQLREGVQLSNIRWSVLLHEAGNFARIFFRFVIS